MDHGSCVINQVGHLVLVDYGAVGGKESLAAGRYGNKNTAEPWPISATPWNTTPAWVLVTPVPPLSLVFGFYLFIQKQGDLHMRERAGRTNPAANATTQQRNNAIILMREQAKVLA